jgi:hypothetical protein
MIDDQDAFFLLAFLRAHQGPDATFMCTNRLGDRFGWHRIRLANRQAERWQLVRHDPGSKVCT